MLRGTLSQDDIVDAEGLLGQVRDLELLKVVIATTVLRRTQEILAGQSVDDGA
jgi:hypothetical protein